MRKSILLAAAAGLLTLSAAFPALAGSWKTGDGENQGRWWYDNGDGTHAAAQWLWIDGNEDGTAECYYFDEAGWLLTSTVTPDFYTVNSEGAWTVDGVVQTKKTTVSSDDEETWEEFQNGDEDEDEKRSSKKKPSSKPFSSSSESSDDGSDNSSGGGPSSETDSSSGGDEKPVYEYPKDSPDSSYRHSKAED